MGKAALIGWAKVLSCWSVDVIMFSRRDFGQGQAHSWALHSFSGTPEAGLRGGNRPGRRHSFVDDRAGALNFDRISVRRVASVSDCDRYRCFVGERGSTCSPRLQTGTADAADDALSGRTMFDDGDHRLFPTGLRLGGGTGLWSSWISGRFPERQGAGRSHLT